MASGYTEGCSQHFFDDLHLWFQRREARPLPRSPLCTFLCFQKFFDTWLSSRLLLQHLTVTSISSAHWPASTTRSPEGTLFGVKHLCSRAGPYAFACDKLDDLIMSSNSGQLSDHTLPDDMAHRLGFDMASPTHDVS